MQYCQNKKIRRIELFASWAVAGSIAATAHGSLVGAVSAEDVDWPQCRVYADEQVLGVAPRDGLARQLGFGDTAESAAWSTDSIATEFRYFVVAFRQAVDLGTVIRGGGSYDLSFLRADAPYPGDPFDDTHWERGSRATLTTLPTGYATRAIRVMHQHSPVAWAPSAAVSVFPDLILLRSRYANLLAIGAQEWRTDNRRQVWIGHWVRPLRPDGVVVLDAVLPEDIGYTKVADEEHPLTVEEGAWQMHPVNRGNDPRVGTFTELLEVSALRIVAAQATERSRPSVFPLAALAPDDFRLAMAPPAPVQVVYEMPMDGFAALHILDEKGAIVRRLMSEVYRDQGPQSQDWDLRDDDGRMAPPGTYRWALLARPPLRLTYEGTVYNAGRPPWLAPVPTRGWWMGDHGAPTTIAGVGDYMVMAASGAEFGTPLIVTDLDGNKVWHTREHGGTHRLVSDGTAAYAVDHDAVYRIVPGRSTTRTRIHQFAYTDLLPGHRSAWMVGDTSGAAARPGLLAVAYQAPHPPWIVSSVQARDIDLQRSLPQVIPRTVHETALTPNEEVLSTFQLGLNSRAAVFGDAFSTGEMANTLVLALRQPVPLGMLLLPPGELHVQVLREGQTLPALFDGRSPSTTGAAGDMLHGGADGGDLDRLLREMGGDFDQRFDAAIWMPLQALDQERGRPLVFVPETGTRTAAIAITGPGLRRLHYALALDRRYRDVAPDARFLPLEGQAMPGGGWHMVRPDQTPLSAGNPAVVALVWDEPTPARGFMMIRPLMWAGLDVEVWTGPDDAVIDRDAVSSDDLWRPVLRHRQNRSHVKYSWHSPMTLRGDFGDTIALRALRVRIVEPPWASRARPGPTVEGGFDGMVVFQPIGSDIALPEPLAHRITLLDLPPADDVGGNATVRTHLPFDQPGAMAFGPHGDLYVAGVQGVMRIREVEHQNAPVAQELVIPREAYRSARSLAIDGDGQLFLLDGQLQQVLVFDTATGRKIRSIGKSGGQVGPYDPETLTAPSWLTLDQNGKLWITEQHFQPKRISRWTREGVFEKDFMGPTHYGGGGVMDPRDRSVINHLGMKFRLNWEDRSWILESRLAPYGDNRHLPDRVLYVGERRYLSAPVTRWLSFGNAGPIQSLCKEIDGVAVSLVEAGRLGDWVHFLRNRDLQQAFRDANPGTTAFIWSDRNRDRVPQLDEIRIIEGIAVHGGVHIGDDLSLTFGDGYRLRVQRVLENGVPVYDQAALQTVPEARGRDVMVDAAGRTFAMGHALLDAAGTPMWRYIDNYASVQRSNQTPWGFYNRPAGVLAGSINLLGHFPVGDEYLYAVNGNNGDYYVFTEDGFLAAAVLGGPAGHGRRFFSMADARPGVTDLSDLRKTVEDFHGHITRAEDGNVYAIAGKNHVTIIRVDGLEALQRRHGSIRFGPDEAEATDRWIAQRVATERLRRRPTRVEPVYVHRPLRIDGDIITDWPAGDPLTILETFDVTGQRRVDHVTARLAFDETHLYVAMRAMSLGSMRNTAEDPALLHQHGDAVDVQLGLNPAADPNRTDPVAGDVRLLLTQWQSQGVALLMRHVADGEPTVGTPYTYRSPMGEVSVADVGFIENAQVAVRKDADSWVLEGAIPWAALGVDPPRDGQRLRGDIGILRGDSDGQATVFRQYWANRENVVLGDLPAETRMHPALWGDILIRFPDIGDLFEDILRDNGHGGPEIDWLPRF